MPKIKLEAEGSIIFAWEFLGKPESLHLDDPYEVEGVEVQYGGAVEHRGIEHPDVMEFLIGYAAGKGLDQFVARLVQLGREALERIRINGEEVPLEDEDILRVIREAEEEQEKAG